MPAHGSGRRCSAPIHGDQQQGTTTGAVSLTVWELHPAGSPRAKSSFRFFQSGTGRLRRELLQEIRRFGRSARPGSAQGVWELSDADTGPFSGADVGAATCRGTFRRAISRPLPPRSSPTWFLYDYSADEIGHCSDLDPDDQAVGHQYARGRDQDLISMSPTPPSTTTAPAAAASAVVSGSAAVMQQQQGGDRTGIPEGRRGLVLQHPGPRCCIREVADQSTPSIPHQRLLNESLKLTGLLYWRVDRFESDPGDVNRRRHVQLGQLPGDGSGSPGEDVGYSA